MTDLEIVKEAFELLSPIPDEEWTIEIQFDNVKRQCCALGHYRARKSGLTTEQVFDLLGPKQTIEWSSVGHASETRTLNNIVKEVVGYFLTSINNGKVSFFSQETPKERTLMGLRMAIDTLTEQEILKTNEN